MEPKILLPAPSRLRYWTKAAIYCWKRHYSCKGCFYYENFNFDCQMKRSVLALVRKFGRPDKAQMKYKPENERELKEDE